MSDSFGARLRAERLRRRLTQEQLAVLGGVSRLSQHLYESDARAPDANYLSKLAEHGIDVGSFFTPWRGRQQTIDHAILQLAYRTVDQVARDELGDLLPVEERVKQFTNLVTALTLTQAEPESPAPITAKRTSALR